MEDNAFKLVRKVILAENLVNGLSEYRHTDGCPKALFPPVAENCNCGADRNNRKIEEIKQLLDVQYLISFG